MWFCFYYEPSATCGGLIVLNMPHLSGFGSFGVIRDEFSIFHFFLFVIFVAINYIPVFHYFGCTETRNSGFSHKFDIGKQYLS